MEWLNKYPDPPGGRKIKNEFLDSKKVLDNLKVDYPDTKVKPDEEKSFLLDYINSGTYEKKLQKSGYKNPDQEVLERAKNVKTVTTDYQTGKPNVFEQVYNKAIDKPYSNSGSGYFGEEHTIVMDNKTDKLITAMDPKYVRSHEMGHAELSDGQFKNRLNDNDNYELLSRSREYFGSSRENAKEVMKHLQQVSHDYRPEENKADLNSLRFLMKKKDIYDATKDEPFTKEHLDKIPDNFIKKRLLKNYSQKDLIWLMNNIAATDKKGWLNKYQDIT